MRLLRDERAQTAFEVLIMITLGISLVASVSLVVKGAAAQSAEEITPSVVTGQQP